MADITVNESGTQADVWEYEVTIREGGTETVHRVHLSSGDYQNLTGGKIPPAKLVEKSFEFLLERETKESILGTFNLSVISRYFPEYESRIKDYF